MLITNVKEWKYKAEGNKHIVFCNNQGKVLRLKKSTIICECNGRICQKCKGAISNGLDELSYHKYVVMPLMKNSSASQCPLKVNITSSFIFQLNQMIKLQRPLYRRHKSLIKSDFGVLMDDKTVLHPGSHIRHILASNTTSDTFSIEVKLKKGFISNFDTAYDDKVCQFCSLQMYRSVNDSKRVALSNYCPLDLFSGDRNSMIKALMSLISCPQNTFRVFKNGKAVFSQELLDQLSGDKNITSYEYLEDLVQYLFPKSFENDLSSNNLTCFLDLLCTALLTPLDNNQQTTVVKHTRCRGKEIKSYFRNKCQVAANYFSNISVENDKDFMRHTTIPSSSILGFVLSSQLLSNVSNSSLRLTYNSLAANFHDSSKHTFDGPYETSSWKSIGQTDIDSLFNEIDVKNNERIIKTDSQCDTISPSNSISLIQKYLVSKSFCDCSVMITLQRVDCSQQIITQNLKKDSIENSSLYLINSSDGSSFLSAISVVDIDPKPSSRIPLYCDQHERLKFWWNKLKTSSLNTTSLKHQSKTSNGLTF